MTYTYNVTKKNECQILLNGKIVDTVGPWAEDDPEGPAIWGAAVCEKYNAPEYANTPYPNQLEPATPTA